MRKFILFCIAVFLLGTWTSDFIHSGRFEKFLDAHPNPQVNPRLEYYWGTLLSLANHRTSAEYRFRRVRDQYPGSAYAPLAWVELIELIDDDGDRKAVLSESNSFLEKFRDHSKADFIKRKITYLQHGY